MKWVLLILVYVAPEGTANWDGPWRYGLSQMINRQFATEADCRNTAIAFIAEAHTGMLVPMRYRCVAVEAVLPRGTPRG